jgi:hypothetical protein
MTKHRKSMVLFLLFINIFCACKKMECSGPTGPIPSMSANIGGTQMNFNANIIFNAAGLNILGVYTPVNLQYHLQFLQLILYQLMLVLISFHLTLVLFMKLTLEALQLNNIHTVQHLMIRAF